MIPHRERACLDSLTHVIHFRSYWGSCWWTNQKRHDVIDNQRNCRISCILQMIPNIVSSINLYHIAKQNDVEVTSTIKNFSSLPKQLQKEFTLEGSANSPSKLNQGYIGLQVEFLQSKYSPKKSQTTLSKINTCGKAKKIHIYRYPLLWVEKNPTRACNIERVPTTNPRQLVLEVLYGHSSGISEWSFETYL